MQGLEDVGQGRLLLSWLFFFNIYCADAREGREKVEKVGDMNNDVMDCNGLHSPRCG